MIEHLLQPLVSEKFLNDPHYGEGHLRIINALPSRRVLGVHIPDMKKVARELFRQGDSVEIIRRFEQTPSETLVYEEMVVWGFLINMQKLSLDQRLAMTARFVPAMDNWAVCDCWCSNAKWMARADKTVLWEFLTPYFSSAREFEVRFAVISAMCYFLNEVWLDKIFEKLNALDFSRIKSEYKTVKGKPETVQEGSVQGAAPYYVRMGVAWLLATALAKFPDRTRRFANSSQLPDDVIRLYVRKARESFRTRTINAL